MRIQSSKKSASKVYHSDLKGFYCNKHSRLFFKKHGLDWFEFVKNGIERETLEAFDDALVNKFLKHADSKNGK